MVEVRASEASGAPSGSSTRLTCRRLGGYYTLRGHLTQNKLKTKDWDITKNLHDRAEYGILLVPQRSERSERSSLRVKHPTYAQTPGWLLHSAGTSHEKKIKNERRRNKNKRTQSRL